MLLWAQSCFKKNIFNDTLICPVSREEIETYIQILLPAYSFNLGLQGSRSSICDVLPGVFHLKNKWSKYVVDDKARELCYFMVHFIQEKFSYELASPIYMVNIFPNLFKKQNIIFKYNLKVAALLKISRLNSWINKPYCKDTIRDGLRSISCVYFSFFPTEPDESTNTDHLPPTTPMTGNSVNSEHFFGRF